MTKLSPSDFAYLYEECKLCYWLKINHNIKQPSMPMPGVFSAMNTRIQGSLIGKNLQTISPDLPDAIVETQEGWVESIQVPDSNIFIKGKYDLLAKQTNGEHILVDLKISQPDIDKVDKYKTQLAAYKFALENPANGEAIKISKMGLLILYPDQVNFSDNNLFLSFPPKWLEIPDDGFTFFKLIKDIDLLLAGPAPAEGENCAWCKYRHSGEAFSH
jgi:CRISPR/Cas system-associated exonuclease Cas4 (RecB family)